MQLSSIRLSNITCFENLSIDFQSEDVDRPAPWVVLLGENGTGKSTILQMIGAALLGFDQVAVIAGDIDWKSYVRNQANPWNLHFLCSLRSEAGDNEYSGDQESTYVYFEGLPGLPPHPILSGFPPHPMPYDEPIILAPETLHGDQLTGGWFACGYSPWRRLSRRSGSDNGAIPKISDSAKPFRFASLFGDSGGLTNVPDWLAGLYVRSIFPGNTEADRQRYEIARDAFLKTIPGIKSIEVTADQEVMVTEYNRQIPLDRLSDGYRGTLAWVGDLIRRLFDAYPNSANPLHERGVVLVDEIDLHLHPRWQRTIVHDIRTLFPNLQFIVTSHSPFVAQGLRPEDRIIVLERAGKNGAVTAREDKGAVEAWSADQILASYFGLPNGTRGDKAQRDEARYVTLLDAEAKGTLTPKKQAELDRLRLRVDQVPIGATPDEESVFRATEALAATLKRQREALEGRRNARTNGHGGATAIDGNEEIKA